MRSAESHDIPAEPSLPRNQEGAKINSSPTAVTSGRSNTIGDVRQISSYTTSDRATTQPTLDASPLNDVGIVEAPTYTISISDQRDTQSVYAQAATKSTKVGHAAAKSTKAKQPGGNPLYIGEPGGNADVGDPLPTARTDTEAYEPRVSGTFEGIGTNVGLSVRQDRTATMTRANDQQSREVARIKSDFGNGSYWNKTATPRKAANSGGGGSALLGSPGGVGCTSGFFARR